MILKENIFFRKMFIVTEYAALTEGKPLKFFEMIVYQHTQSLRFLVVVNQSLQVLLDFSLTVKAATLIFIHVSGCGSAISSAKEGKSGFIYNLVKTKSFLSRANVRAFHENPNRIHTELTFINP